MQRIIFVPQYPVFMRYPEWWAIRFPIEFQKRGFEVKILGEDIMRTSDSPKDPKVFSDQKASIHMDTQQINEYMKMELRKDDILFLSDISYPGIFPHVLFHKRPNKCFSFCHATSINNLDYFSPDKKQKFPIETALSELFNKVFVGSEYHQKKLGWKNTVVTYLPMPPFTPIKTELKEKEIISVARVTPQKVNIELESIVEEMNLLKIFRPISKTWQQYYYNLSISKILLVTSSEETFGYQIVDAILNGCIPLAPNNFSYPELLHRDYLYDDKGELLSKIDYILHADFDLVPEVSVPKILCEEQMNIFYDKICNEMRE